MFGRWGRQITKFYGLAVLVVVLIGFSEFLWISNKATTRTLDSFQTQASVVSHHPVEKLPKTSNKTSGFEVKEVSLSDVQNSVNNSLQFIPAVPDVSHFDIVPQISQKIVDNFLILPETLCNYNILILTPVRNVAKVLQSYADILGTFTYPHNMLTVFFGEDGSSDGTLNASREAANTLVDVYEFRAAATVQLNLTGGITSLKWEDIHKQTAQKIRRSHMAKSRNKLLSSAIETDVFDYVLWIDSDVGTLPTDIIQQLLFAKADVVAPCCLYVQKHYKYNYDRNSWRETPESLNYQKHMSEDFLMLEGYLKTKRILLPDLKAEGRVVRLDGVGGCVLLVRAECHRQGLVFPEKVYNHHIETEGLAKMATDMGFSVRGMPWVEVIHR
ncbi:uncharacterized protein LOC128230362 [Mya arenaria]|uniref:uncharacterized protein LOC128230362 n=1 Tax=Mya arenaria TaxID=6604 RepID=UPI0022E7F128|nr:uncharacterized protein LOC128230362 [Mya arenaria]